MGFVSDRANGYRQGFDDGFLGQVKRYKLQRFYSVVSYLAAKTSTPEREYVAGYDDGYSHGQVARVEFKAFAGDDPHDTRDWSWWRNEKDGREKMGNWDRSELFTVEDYKARLAHWKTLLADARLGTVLREAEVFFHASGNMRGVFRCSKLKDRLAASHKTEKDRPPSDSVGRSERELIVEALEALIEEEMGPARPQSSGATTSSSSKSTRSASPVTSERFVVSNEARIRDVIVEAWRIPQTVLPGQYAEVLTRIVRWFDNFSPSEYEDALQVLCAVRVLSIEDVDALVSSLASEVQRLFGDELKNLAFCALGQSGGSSGSQFLYSLKQKLALPDGQFPLDYRRLRDQVRAVVFVDDFIGSGRQAQRFQKDHLGQVQVAQYYFSLLAYKQGLDFLRSASGFQGVFAAKQLDDSARAFSPLSRTFSDEDARVRIMEMAHRYGQTLYPKGPLGFDDGQALIVFPHNTPNNSLPVIWASPRNEKTIGVPWNPLWERRKPRGARQRDAVNT